MEIRYLEQEEKGRSRGLWEQCFAEDSARFLDYYYEEKCRDNRILVLEDQGRICSMLQRNPYQIVCGDRAYELDYIVGVATDPERRHQGCMRRLLMQMFKDQQQAQMPFTFLMPADPAIYRPFGFVYVYDQPFWRLNEAGRRLRRERIEDPALEPASDPSFWQGRDQEAASAADPRLQGRLEEAGKWLNRWLSERYQIFAGRDGAYMLRLWKEIVSEYGRWELLYDGERLVGMECFWGKERKERRFLYAEEKFTEPDREPRPAIMARIVNLAEFLGAARLKPGFVKAALDKREYTVTLGILDHQIRENHGLFSWRLTEEGSQLQKLCDEIPDQARTVTIEALTQWLMGYRRDEIPEDLADAVQTVKGIFLDEVV